MPRVYDLPESGKVVVAHVENSNAEEWAEERGLNYLLTLRVPWDKIYMIDIDALHMKWVEELWQLREDGEDYNY